MELYKQYIYRFKAKRKNNIRKEFKRLILRSIYKNMGCNDNIRFLAFLKIQKFNKKTWISKHRNTCLILGKRKGIYNPTNLSRHAIKSVGKTNSLTNLKIKSW